MNTDREARATVDCSFCGLPTHNDAVDVAQVYCCTGCRFAATVTAADGDEGQARWTMTRLGIAVFFAMNVMVFTMLLWSQDRVAADELSRLWYGVARFACLLFTLPVLFLLGGTLVEDAYLELRRGRPSLSLLLLLGVIGSLLYSVHSLLVTDGHVYFEVAAIILVAVTLGRWFEATGKLQTTAALRGLAKLLPAEVRKMLGSETEIAPADQLQVGEHFKVLPGERIAADGVIVQFAAAVDEQVITGESMPVEKQVGDAVQSGSLVLDGPLVIEARAVPGEGMLARMIQAVEQAAASKCRYQRVADSISSWFLLAVTITAISTFAAHCYWRGVAEGILAALSVVVIACPCALGLATPMALWAAIGRAAQAGVMIREGDALSILASAPSCCFDKTGTLTTGQPTVIRFDHAHEYDEQTLLCMIQALSSASNHPLAMALGNYAQLRCASAMLRDTSPDASWSEIEVIPGCGIRARSSSTGDIAYLGNLAWLKREGLRAFTEFQLDLTCHDQCAETYFACEGAIVARVLFQEDLRPEAHIAVEELKQLGMSIDMLTGDREERAARLASDLAISYQSQLMPHQKLEVVTQKQQKSSVIMVGDGVNDAPALAAADVSISLGCGTDISRNAASICLLQSDLRRIGWLVKLSRETVSVIRWNLFWAFGYNAAGIALAAAGLLHPIIAAVAMGISSFLVVGNSLRLAHFPLELDGSPATSGDDPSDAPRQHIATDHNEAQLIA
ncbi:heavy metal translocating P-type ATPase [Pirellula staleyi DSM 6068]|uniref:Heavy metal translocating P-type ATPase n=1 Tax=Pirellula staleyi (strain ATCC 27377 / DSM 6068 / ICPB 4128) TaxID=530564 RepID=D2QYL1_PIRSD|nr:cation-translocating P-type ATPase [Pirellula staleyi]ADB18170.1 heavy metal translocating P-type ATPase [Pirellula staleyi DSM 6068]